MRNTSVSVRLLSLILVAAPFACKRSQVATVKDEGETTTAPGADTFDALFDEQAKQESGGGTLNPQTSAGMGLTEGEPEADGATTTTPAASSDDSQPPSVDQLIQAVDVLTTGESEGTQLKLTGDDGSLAELAATADAQIELKKAIDEREKADQGTELRLADSKELTDARAELARLKLAMTKLEATIKRYETGNRFYTTLTTQPDQFNCTYHRAVRRGDKCQCRGWGFDVAGYAFDVPKTQVLRDLLNRVPPKCPVLDKLFCVGDATKGGSCGLFGKDVGYDKPAIKTSPRLSADTGNECYHTIDDIILKNRDIVFGAPNSCGTEIAIQRGNVIEMWLYEANRASTNYGQYIRQLTGAGQTAGTNNSQADSRLGPTTTAIAGSSAATTAFGFQTLCTNLVGANGRRAEWTTAIAGGACRCGTGSVSADVYLRSYSASDRNAFPAACREFLAR